MIKPILFSSMVLLGLAGCGQSEAPETAVAAPTPVAQPVVATQPDPAGRLIEITASDSLRFSVTEITAAPGEKIRVKLTNLGTMPKQAMGHNFILLKAEADPEVYASAAIQAAQTDFEPAALADQVIAATKLLGPKESDTITFTVPETPGTYPFLCSFPAHFIAGMKGVLVVK